MAFCPNCGKANANDAKFCFYCGSGLTTTSNQAASPVKGPESISVPSDRPFTSAESSALTTFGANQRSWAGAIGFVNILLGAFALIESPQDLGSDGGTFLALLTFSMGIIAISAGVASRRSRSLAAKALSLGRVLQAQGTVRGSTMRATQISVPNGILEVPKPRSAGAREGFAGVKLGPEGSRADVVFTKPPSPNASKVALLSLNGSMLSKAVMCKFSGGTSA
jgi:hypothetical protein